MKKKITKTKTYSVLGLSLSCILHSMYHKSRTLSPRHEVFSFVFTINENKSSVHRHHSNFFKLLVSFYSPRVVACTSKKKFLPWSRTLFFLYFLADKLPQIASWTRTWRLEGGRSLQYTRTRRSWIEVRFFFLPINSCLQIYLFGLKKSTPGGD